MSTTRRAKPLAWLLIAPLALGSVAFVGPAASATDTHTSDVVDALERAAHPLRSTEPTGGYADLRPFGRMVRGTDVVGVGEATHNSHEFFTTKHRLFRYLVEKKGFTTYSLEIGWSTGVRIDQYVRHGTGDIRRVMREEFRGLTPWENREYLGLFEWMRTYNTEHPDHKLRFSGNDLNYPTLGTELADLVIDDVRQRFPAYAQAFVQLYKDFRAVPDGLAYDRLPIAEKRAIAKRAELAYDLLQVLAAKDEANDRWVWTRQHARSIRHTTEWLTFDYTDPVELRKAMRYRDRVMAANTAWWTERHGDRVLLSAHNGHVSKVTDMPEQYPKTQGGFLLDRLGSRYLSVGFSFDRGGFNATDANGYWTKTYTVGQAPDGFNEATLDDVRYRDYIVDTRVAPPIVRDWLDVRRPTRSIGTEYPTPDVSVALARSYDVLIHLHRVSRAQPLPG